MEPNGVIETPPNPDEMEAVLCLFMSKDGTYSWKFVQEARAQAAVLHQASNHLRYLLEKRIFEKQPQQIEQANAAMLNKFDRKRFR